MPNRIVQPTKEQVRAYMTQREGARRPPPAPEEIRRQLGWCMAPAEETFSLTQFYLIPTVCSHVVAELMVQWWGARTRAVVCRHQR